MDKNETQVDRKTLGDVFELGKYRFQEYKDDKVHVHDDDKHLVFEYIGKRPFQVGVEEFLNTHHKHDIGTKMVIRGEKSPEDDVKGIKKLITRSRGAADVILTKTDNGWDFTLEPAGTIQGTQVIADKTLAFLSDFIDSF